MITDQSCNRLSASGRLLGFGQRVAGNTGSVSLGEVIDTLGSSAIGMVLIFRLVVRDGIAIVIGLILSIFEGRWAAGIRLIGSQIIGRLMSLLGWQRHSRRTFACRDCVEPADGPLVASLL